MRKNIKKEDFKMYDGGESLGGNFSGREKRIKRWQWAEVLMTALLGGFVGYGFVQVLNESTAANLFLMVVPAIMMVVWFYLMVLQDYATLWFIENSKRLYLCRHTLYNDFDSMLFERLAGYVGHGLCYEVAAIEMLMLASETSAQIVIGRRYMVPTHHRERHAWVEFERYGVWWVADPMLESLIIVPKWLYNLRHKVHMERTLQYHEFWAVPISDDLYNCMCEEATSWVFNELVYFHGDKIDGKVLLGYERVQRLPKITGEKIDPRLYEVYCAGRPITEEVIDRFLNDPGLILIDPESLKKIAGEERAAELLKDIPSNMVIQS